MTQKELAAYAGTSTSAVQAIELRKLKLSQKLAFRISEVMGVDYGWLLTNDLTKPPINQYKEPYSEADLVRAKNKYIKRGPVSELDGKMELVQAYYCLRQVWEEVVKYPDQLPFFLHRLRHFINSERDRIPKGKVPKKVVYVDPTVMVPASGDKIMEGPVSLFPIANDSFDAMEADVYECRKAFEQAAGNQPANAVTLKQPKAKGRVPRTSK